MTCAFLSFFLSRSEQRENGESVREAWLCSWGVMFALGSARSAPKPSPPVLHGDFHADLNFLYGTHRQKLSSQSVRNLALITFIYLVWFDIHARSQSHFVRFKSTAGSPRSTKSPQNRFAEIARSSPIHPATCALEPTAGRARIAKFGTRGPAPGTKTVHLG